MTRRLLAAGALLLVAAAGCDTEIADDEIIPERTEAPQIEITETPS